jgi:hypothetical protein
MRTSIISKLVLASVTSLALLLAGGPAAAKPMNCQGKHTSCTQAS